MSKLPSQLVQLNLTDCILLGEHQMDWLSKERPLLEILTSVRSILGQCQMQDLLEGGEGGA
jgi:hypothetical protein